METIKLKKIAKVITGFPFKGELYSSEGIKTVRGENITEGKLRWDTIKCWNHKFDKEEEYLLKSDDIVIGMDGSKVGKNKARINKDDLPLLLAQRVACLRSLGKNDQVFLYYLINNPRFEEYVFKTQTGSSVPHISKNQIEDFEVPKIELITQQKIAKVLSDLDAKIDFNNKINAELEAMAKTFYDYWFVQFDFPDKDGKPYKSSGGKMVWDNALKREIPEGWEVKKLENIIDRIIDYRGRTPKKLNYEWSDNINDIIAISAKHIKKGKLVNLNEANRVNCELYSKWMKEELSEGDILMTSEAPCGEFFYLIGDPKYCLSQRVFAIRSNNKIVNHSYLYFELSCGNGYSQIMGKVSGSTVFGIRQDELRTVNVLIPDKNLQNRFEEKSFPIYKKIRINEKQNQELAALRDWLLPMLMNGQITVGEVEGKLGMVAERGVEYKKS
ncbi:restriction endonuclease subunit S [Flavobacterium poyangense]|uniref:restriction endonuclease subunit S n=1 Tax=Flavobacterium poyangense TaxID=2204302 RepID=UPI0014243C13|nr:restriction endonuclease subunit S [Flavobacterium sp. JXAS1]